MGIRASSGGQIGGGSNSGGGGGLTVENVQDIVSESVVTASTVEGVRLTSTYDDTAGKIRLNFSTDSQAPITNVVPGSVVVENAGMPVGSAKTFNFAGSGIGSISLANDIATINVTGGAGIGAVTLDELTDVIIASPTTGQILKFNGTNWVNGAGAVDGINGANGKSAYELAVLAGFVGSESAWLASLTGQQGQTGPQGAAGAAGAQGAQGPAGQRGEKGDQGVSVTLLGSVQSISDLPPSGTAGNGWIVQDNGDLYIWNSITYTWNNIGQIVGPQGDEGPAGPQGAQGPAGAIGPQGPQGIQGPPGTGAGSALNLYQNNVSQGAVTALNFAGAVVSVDQNGIGTITITGGTGAVDSVNGLRGAVVLSTDEITEGTSHQYFTNSRFDSRFATKTTDTLTEGSANFYFTNTRFDSRLATKTADNIAEGSSNLYFTNTRFDSRLSTKTSDNIAEGSSNKYFTDARARGVISSATVSGPGSIAYSSSTGVISYTGPTNAEIRTAFTAGTGITLLNGQIGVGAIPNSALSNASITIAGHSVALGGSTTISVGDLAGVDITSNAPISGQALVWDGSKWVPGAPTAAGTVSSVNSKSGIVTLTSTDIAEGTNKYYTDTRARAAISTSGWSNLSYNNSTGVITITAPTTDNVTEGTTNKYYTDARFDTRFATKTTTGLAEGTNLYYTSVRANADFDTRFATKTTTGLTEGTNLYYTSVRANADFDTRLATKSTTNLAEGTNLYYTDARFDTRLATKSTTNLAEGTNLYYTDARADARIGAANLQDLADVTSATPGIGQVLKWDGSAWAPANDQAGAGIFAVTCQVDYDASGNLTGATILNGIANATISNATSAACEVTFEFTGAKSPPLTTTVYGYQRVTNVYVQRAVDANFTKRVVAGGGTSGSPTAFTNFTSGTNTMVVSLTKALTGASASAGQTTHCVVQFTLV